MKVLNIILPLLVVCAARSTVSFAQESAPSKPHIVYIVADDLGWADLGCQGQSKDVRTPHIDSLAAGGVRFTNGYVTGVVCSPTRAGLMTGRYQQRFGHEFNPGPSPPDTVGLPLDQVTLAQALKSAGYVTGMVGKWHLGMAPPFHPQRRGFDEFFGFLSGSHDYNTSGSGRHAILRGDERVGEIGYLTDTLGAEACAFIDRHARTAAERPMFLYLTFNAVHTPMQAPQRYLDRFPDVADGKRRTMLAMLSAMDDAVGQLLAKLRQHGLEQQTLIVFHSDNGGPTPANGSLNTPLSGLKGTVGEGGIRVPFLVQWKKAFPGGRVIDTPVIALDVFATAIAAAGAKPGAAGAGDAADAADAVKLDGVDLLPLLRDSAERPPPHEHLFWRMGGQWAVRDARYKLRRLANAPSAELFDLSADPGERTDLAQNHPEIVERLRAAYDAWDATLVKPLWDQRVRKPNGGRGRNATTTSAAPSGAES